jgi:hypothetical protein
MNAATFKTNRKRVHDRQNDRLKLAKKTVNKCRMQLSNHLEIKRRL